MAKTNEKKRDFFWLSYSDLMTSLFFVMLVLFVLVYTMQNKMIGELKVKEIELNRIKEIEKTVSNIDRRYFVYDSINKKHILNINFTYPTNVSDIYSIRDPGGIKSQNQLLGEFINAGVAIKKLVLKFPEAENIKYLVVVEGQASKDGAPVNDDLSFHRAQSLIALWKSSKIGLDDLKNCEIIVAGSGEKGIPRIIPDKPPANQRFLITIIPKIGEMRKK
jgi:hypothetical protein